MIKSPLFVLVLLALSSPLALADSPYRLLPPSPLPGLHYEVGIYPADADHDPAVPTPQDLIGHPVGQRAASNEAIDQAVRHWAEHSDRAEVVEYARSHEDRPLIYIVISSPENLARQGEVRAGMARLADPRNLSAARQNELVEQLPAVAWMAYSIHGNESSGSDAALAVIYHLLADRSETTQRLLDELVIIVDPNMNPDGRQRFLHSVSMARGTQPDVDDQSLVHTGYWPFGRGNHYYFDLNRDWIYAIHPETRGRIEHISSWHPLLFVDAHEMGSQDSYLFSPAREPHNPHLPPYRGPWGEKFAADQARAFDRYAYPYYTGEWFEDFYPGYTDTWASLRGAQGILYEQARIAEDAVQQDAVLVSYAQSVHQQMISTWANLETLRANRQEMLTGFADDRRQVSAADGPYGQRSFAILPSENAGRMAVLLDLVQIQGFEVFELTESRRVRRATDQLGRERRDVQLPAGTLILPNRQPEGRLLAAMFEFDTRLSESSLRKEREAVLARSSSTIYDSTAWNITMMFGLEALEVPEHLSRGLRPLDFDQVTVAAETRIDRQAIAYLASSADDRAIALGGRLMEAGLVVRASNRESRLDEHDLPRGSIMVTRDDNRARSDWEQQLSRVSAELGLAMQAVGHGLAPGDKADFGGRHWQVLTPPRIALVGRGGTNMLDVGVVWYVLDHRLGLRHSLVDEDRLGNLDLRRYNVIYLPERWPARWGGRGLSANTMEALADWVRNGGTLIAAGDSARALASVEDSMIRTRELGSVIGEDLSGYQDAIYREWLASQEIMPEASAIWGREAPTGLELPWQDLPALPDAEARKREDRWRALFMPSGAMVANRVDPEHWLTAGSNGMLPGLLSNSPLLMSAPPAQTPLRIGVYVRGSGNETGLAGWAPVPDGHELVMRMSGLLWPEARQRVASAGWLVREQVGRGQVILFAHPPAFRGAKLGTIRVLENALILGPGLGSNQPVVLP